MLQRSDTRGSGRLALGAAALIAAAIVAGCVPEAPGGADEALGPDTRGSSGAFEVRLRWDAPTVDAEGHELDDLAGFRLYWAPDSAPLAEDASTRDLGLESETTVSDLAAGMWRFAVSAVDTAGNESGLSDPVTVEVGP